ncbi:hypothetical protein Pelo_490 [Pelomyxa schiedti]|nr:hypothetical protein Pelo_490 [Pelomyxa schiedti]
MQSNSESIELKKLSGELAKLRKSLSLSEEKNFHLEKQLQGKNLEISSLNTQIADLKAVKLNLEKQLIVAKSSFNRGRDDIPRPKSAGPAYRRPASPISKSPSTSYLSPVVNAPHQQINSTNNTLGTKLPLPTQPSTNLPAPKRPVSQSTPKSNSTNKPTTPLTHKPPYQLHKKPPTVTQPQNNDSSKIPPRKTPNKPGNTKVPGQSGIPAPSFVAKKLVAKTPASPQHPPKPTGLNPLSKRPPSTPSHPTSFSTKKPLSASGSSRPTISASNNRNSKRPPSRTSVPPKPSPTKFTVKPPVPVTSPIKSASKPGTPKESQAAEDNQCITF